jgi:REP element-mobilizing transposase RayT
MIRGIEGAPIVSDDRDRADFVDAIATLSYETDTAIFAWALMTNHAHLLIKSGPSGLSAFMRRLLTGYAIRYNLRHKRQGYLFQNRYKSIVCQEDEYFIQLVSYIHLNPLRAGLVRSLEELDRYMWCGHSVLMGDHVNGWQRSDDVLRCFAENKTEARQHYRDFIAGQIDVGKRPDLTGGGLIRSMGRWSIVKSMRGRPPKELRHQSADPRILGNGDFVDGLLQQTERRARAFFSMDKKIVLAEKELVEMCERQSVSVDLLKSGVRRREIALIRRALAKRMIEELGLTLAETARLLGISTSGVAEILRRYRRCDV